MTIKVPGGGARPPRPLTEAGFQRQVTDLAERRGWRWLHIPRSSSRGVWRTQAHGPLGKGWPDLLLSRAGRLIVAELKAQRGATTPEQREVLAWLGQAIEVYVWRPSDWDVLESVLR